MPIANLRTADASELPDDLIPLREARALVPSRVPGQRINPSTLWRWILKGRLRAWRCAGVAFVSRGELLGLFRPVEPGQRFQTGREVRTATVKMRRETEEILRRHGLLPDPAA
jgi:hypothetical protein